MNMDISRQLIKHAHMQSQLDSLDLGDPEVIIVSKVLEPISTPNYKLIRGYNLLGISTVGEEYEYG